MVYTTMDRYYELLNIHGADKVKLNNFVTVFKHKVDPSGAWLKCGARITIADTAASGKAAVTFAGCVGQDSIRIMSQVAAQTPGARIVTTDVPGAYYHGDPPHPDSPEGRHTFARLPGNEWAEFGLPDKHPRTGKRMCMLIKGNMPGLQTAGRIWSLRIHRFPHRQGPSRRRPHPEQRRPPHVLQNQEQQTRPHGRHPRRRQRKLGHR
jgi:hypothetical protein